MGSPFGLRIARVAPTDKNTSPYRLDIVLLGGLTELRSLNLMSTHVRGAGILQLKRLAMLQNLNLQCTQLGDEGLAAITSLSSLRALDLGFTGITDRALAFFRVTGSQDDPAGSHGLMKLATMNLNGTRIDGPGLANLADLTHLHTISLDGSQVSIRPVRVLLRSIFKKIAHAVSGLAVTIV